MYSSLIIDFSRVLIYSHQEVDSLNKHHKELRASLKNYSVLDHFYLNTELITYLVRLKPELTIYLFSDGQLHGIPEINKLISHIFSRIFTAEEIGYKKDDKRAYTKVMDILDLDPGLTLFVDDKKANVDAASTTGIRAIQFIDNAQLMTELNQLIKRP